MNTQDQIQLINDTISKTKDSLKSGLTLAGLFTLMPGRYLHDILF